MNRSKWLSWLLLLCISVVLAIALTGLTSSQFLQSTRYEQPALSTNDTLNPHQNPYGEETDDGRSANAQSSRRVDFPANYRDQFIQYVTVDCPNSRIVRKMYVNPTALESLQADETVPSGTVIVMETHSAQQSSDGQLRPTRLNNVFIREKRTGWSVNEDSGEWRSAWYSPQGAMVSNRQSSCIGCHQMVRDRDYLFTLPALLTAAQTGQKQYQATEFGTSVCR